MRVDIIEGGYLGGFMVEKSIFNLFHISAKKGPFWLHQKSKGGIIYYVVWFHKRKFIRCKLAKLKILECLIQRFERIDEIAVRSVSWKNNIFENKKTVQYWHFLFIGTTVWTIDQHVVR